MIREGLRGDSLLSLDTSGDRTPVEISGTTHPDIQRKGRNRFSEIARRALVLATAGAFAFSVLVGNPVPITAQEVPAATQQAGSANENDTSPDTCTPPGAPDTEAKEEFIEGPLGCKQVANQLDEPVAALQAQASRTARILSCVTSGLTVEELRKEPRNKWRDYMTEWPDGFIPIDDNIKTSGISYSSEPIGGDSFGFIATYTATIPEPGQGRVWKNHKPAFIQADVFPGKPARLVDGVWMTFPPIYPSTNDQPTLYRVFGRYNEDGSPVWPIIYGYALWNDAGDQVLSGKVCYAARDRLPAGTITPPYGDWDKLGKRGMYQ